MFEAPADLPDDPVTLQAILRAALAEIERLQFQLAGLRRNRFARRSEKLADETVQQATEDLEQSVAEKLAALEAAAKAKTKPSAAEPAKRNRGALPAHLPRVEVIVDVADKACACCGGSLHQIGEDQAEMLDYVPAQGAADPPAALRLPRLRKCCRPGRRTRPSNRRRHGDRGADSAGVDRQV